MADRLWYNQPATKWQDGLPIGNGRIGAVVISNIATEVWSLNDITFWSGKFEATPEDEYGGGEALTRIREKYFANDFVGGRRLAEKYLQPKKRNFGTNLRVAEILLDFPKLQRAEADAAITTKRELNLDEATVSTECWINGYKYSREVFMSHAHQLLVARITTDAPEGFSSELSVKGVTESFRITNVSDGQLAFETRAVETIHSDGTCGVRGMGIIKVGVTSGMVHNGTDKLFIQGATEMVIRVAFNTDFREKGDGWKARAVKQLEETNNMTYSQLRASHISDYQLLYRRVQIDLGKNDRSTLSTDQRRHSLALGYDDPELFSLFFQYARYLTIAGTREDSPLPLHLQGLWNDGEANAMNWSCDYHLDINTQMNYFPTEIANLPELHVPLMHYCEYLAVSGRETAKQSYGAPGWVAHVFSNVWGFSDPGWETSWGLNVTGGLWIAAHMIEHYEYTTDREYLATKAYPVLKEAACFFLNYMTVDPRTGYLVTGPSVSPENSFYPFTERNEEHHLSLAPTIDIILVRELFQFCIRAVNELGNADLKFASELTEALEKLPPFKIGKQGQLQEWAEDYKEAQPDHRHLSHTMALCRSNQITLRHSPDLASATQVSIKNRRACNNLEDIEFTAVLLGLNYARLNDSSGAFDQLGHLIADLTFENLLTYSKPGIAGAEANIFVVDGNYGGAAVVAEMLLRSIFNGPKGVEIDLLPALPDQWPTGFVRGLRARGNIEVFLEWTDGKLITVELKTYSVGKATVYYQQEVKELDLIEDGFFKLNGSLELV
ncbi:putative alpha-L-fucosidase 2 precursor [Talaromyces proteolyticus]|uniref:Alpha-L-fucosidase 2 n=1 Tax=Talaromyces proteolyticus TaxID=1131652 RepID=A0AAD4PU96_9EURO|nr:putative alpha-L-fucosidase 2 precursor [Talaromyces proteolyticus]KAH8694856.1 putative alpha-L-fucosidase 2 precursor [Talaromyces proteolyticus]